MIAVAKMGGKIVEVVRVAESVAFSEEKGWVCIVEDFEKIKRKQEYVRWVPASTRFEWFRTFKFI